MPKATVIFFSRLKTHSLRTTQNLISLRAIKISVEGADTDFEMTRPFSFEDKLVVLKLNKLNHIPSARFSAEILLEEGFPVLIFEYGRDFSSGTFYEWDLPTRRFGASFSYLPSKLWAIATFLRTFFYLFFQMKRERPRLLVTHGLQEQLLAFLLNRFLGIEYVAHVHEIFDLKDVVGLNKIFIFLERYCLRNANFTIFSSQERADIFKQRHGLSRSPVIAFNTPRLRTQTKDKESVLRKEFEGKKVLFYLGGLAPMNACEEIIESMRYLSNEYVLVLAGWGSEEYTRQLKGAARATGVEERIQFVGPVKNKWDWIETADLGLCLYKPVDLRTQYNAGPSNKLFEFISAGVPVLTNEAEDFKAIVEKQGLGVTVNPNRPKEIASAIEKVFQNQVFTQSASSKSLELHQTIYHYEKQFEPVLKNFSEVFPSPSMAKAA